MTDGLILHGYWRSGAAYRVRIALALKGLEYATIAHDLRKAQQSSDAYTALAPQGLVPALETPDGVLTQSIAIIEYLEECYPDPPLLPRKPGDRAIVRAMTALIACDIHPLGNLRVLNALRTRFDATDEQTQDWIRHWMAAGFTALETQVSQFGRGFCFGEQPSMADCALIPQLYAAQRFNLDCEAFPRLREIGQRAATIPAIAAAHPALQLDAN